MGRISNTENFGKRNYNSKSKSPKKIFILSVEGNKTEFDYFSYISDCKKELGIDVLINIEILERIDTKSSPHWVYKLLEEYKEDYGIKDQDKLWMIIDRDRQNNSPDLLNKIIEDCNENNFNIALTNPCFELWLLLHSIINLDEYDLDKLLKNPKRSVKARKRFIDEELTRINGSYNKKKLNKDHFIDINKIKNAIILERDLENSPKDIIESLGSNIGTLVNEIIGFSV